MNNNIHELHHYKRVGSGLVKVKMKQSPAKKLETIVNDCEYKIQNILRGGGGDIKPWQDTQEVARKALRVYKDLEAV